MWLDKFKKKAKNIEKYAVKHSATPENMAKLKQLAQTNGVSVGDIKYITPSGEVIMFDTPEELENYLNKSDELDLDSIKDKPEQPSTVYGNSKKRNTKKCPHCDYVFDTPPIRGKKCPKCGNQFYVRAGNRLFASDLLSFEQMTASDCFRDMTNSGVNVEYAKKLKDHLVKKWGKEPSLSDLMWSIARNFPETFLLDPLKLVDTAADLYFQLARYEDACGRNPRQALEAYIRQNIAQCEAHMKAEKINSDYLYVMSEYCCDACKTRHGKKVKIDDALKKMPIPFKDCQNKLDPKSKYHFCRSYYIWFDPRV